MTSMKLAVSVGSCVIARWIVASAVVSMVTGLRVEHEVVQRGEPEVEERERRGDGQDRTSRVGVVADAVDVLHGAVGTRGPVGRHGHRSVLGFPDART